MDDFKKLAVEFYGMVLEQQAPFGVLTLTKSDEMFDSFINSSHRVNDFMIEHQKEFERALIEVKANEMLNSEV